MPSQSKAQHNLMAMVANDPAAAKRTGIPQSVGARVHEGRQRPQVWLWSRADVQSINKPKTEHGKSAIACKEVVT
jgi:hypothetical protein